MEHSLEIDEAQQGLIAEVDPSNWGARSAFWHRQNTVPKTPVRRARQPKREPLILTGHGVRLRIDNGALHIRGGLTHYPQEPEMWRFFPGDLKMPSRIIVVDGSGGISFDVMGWLSEQNIPLIRIDWKGNVTSIVGNAIAVDPDKVAVQRATAPLPIAISLISQKVENSVRTLKSAFANIEIPKSAICRLNADKFELENRPPKTISALLGIEGRAANSYFSAWQGIPLNWNGISRRPIPDDWHFVGPRQSALGGKKGKNKRASHPVNAMLNYAYAILENQVRTELVAEGFDPSIGYLHANDRERHALVFDLMEPARPLVDLELLRFILAQVFHPKDFVVRNDGVCRMNPELAKRLAKEVVPNPYTLAGLSDYLGPKALAVLPQSRSPR